MQNSQTQQDRKILHKKLLYRLGVLAMIPLLAACSAASASSNGVAQVASPTTTAQAGTASDDYVLIWLLNGTPTQTQTVNPTTAALWATIHARTQTAAQRHGH